MTCGINESMLGLSSAKSASRLEQIAALRARGLGNHINLPQLVVSGDQSAGKSSVLEGLTGLPFPRQDGLCTKFATEILLHHKDTDKTVIIASLIPGIARDETTSRVLSTYRRTLQDLLDLPDVIKEAGGLMGIRGFGDSTEGPSFGQDLLKIEVSGPVGLHLSVVDLPGIILVPNEEQTEEDVETVHNLVDQYLENPRAIILAVVQAGNDIANQSIIRKSRKFDPNGQRTVGIITKPDLINEGSEKRIALLAKNQDTTKLNLGYFLLKDPAPTELDAQASALEREAKELSFFQTSVWRNQNLDKSRVGIRALPLFLQKLLDRHIESELPKVREEINAFILSIKQSLDALGAERPDIPQMRLFLSRLVMDFHNITTAALGGDYHDTDPAFFPPSTSRMNDGNNRLRAQIHQLNMNFSNVMRENGQKRKISEQHARTPSPDIVAPQEESVDMLSGGDPYLIDGLRADEDSQLHVSRKEMIEWIKETYRLNRGKELPGNTNHVLLSELFHVQSSRWHSMADTHIDSVHRVVCGFMRAALEYVIKEDNVRKEVAQIIFTALSQNAQAAKGELQRLLDDEKQQPITYNHYYTDNIQKSRQNFLRNAIDKAMSEATDLEWNGKLHISNNTVDRQRLLTSIQQRIIVDMDVQACEEALAGLNAYYKVALKTFVDNVCRQVVERHLVRRLPAVFQPEDVIVLGEQDLERIAAEPIGTPEKRRELRSLLDSLCQSLNDLQG